MLGEEKVEFVIVGGYAVAFHGYVRATEDLDLFFRNSPNGNTDVSYISRVALLHNKRESARPKDLADVDELGGNRSESGWPG